MAYGIRWQAEVEDPREGYLHRVSIYEDGYVSSSTSVQYAGEPALEVDFGGEDQDIWKAVVGTGLRVGLIDGDASIYEAIKGADERDYWLRYERSTDGGSTYHERFRGWVRNDLTERTTDKYHQVTEVAALDGLQSLEDVPYAPYWLSYGVGGFSRDDVYTGKIRLLDVLCDILQLIEPGDGVLPDLDLRVAWPYDADSMSAGCTWSQLYDDAATFLRKRVTGTRTVEVAAPDQEFREGRRLLVPATEVVEPMTCLEVLGEILLGGRLHYQPGTASEDPHWLFIHPEYTYTAHTAYNFDTSAKAAATPSSTSVSAPSTVLSLHDAMLTGGRVRDLRGYKVVEIKHLHDIANPVSINIVDELLTPGGTASVNETRTGVDGGDGRRLVLRFKVYVKSDGSETEWPEMRLYYDFKYGSNWVKGGAGVNPQFVGSNPNEYVVVPLDDESPEFEIVSPELPAGDATVDVTIYAVDAADSEGDTLNTDPQTALRYATVQYLLADDSYITETYARAYNATESSYLKERKDSRYLGDYVQSNMVKNGPIKGLRLSDDTWTVNWQKEGVGSSGRTIHDVLAVDMVDLQHEPLRVLDITLRGTEVPEPGGGIELADVIGETDDYEGVYMVLARRADVLRMQARVTLVRLADATTHTSSLDEYRRATRGLDIRMGLRQLIEALNRTAQFKVATDITSVGGSSTTVTPTQELLVGLDADMPMTFVPAENPYRVITVYAADDTAIGDATADIVFPTSETWSRGGWFLFSAETFKWLEARRAPDVGPTFGIVDQWSTVRETMRREWGSPTNWVVFGERGNKVTFPRTNNSYNIASAGIEMLTFAGDSPSIPITYNTVDVFDAPWSMAFIVRSEDTTDSKTICRVSYGGSDYIKAFVENTNIRVHTFIGAVTTAETITAGLSDDEWVGVFMAFDPTTGDFQVGSTKVSGSSSLKIVENTSGSAPGGSATACEFWPDNDVGLWIARLGLYDQYISSGQAQEVAYLMSAAAAKHGAEVVVPAARVIEGGELRVGSGTVGTDFTGIRIWESSFELWKLAGLNTDVEQVYIDTDGKMYAGAGAVVIDEDGIEIDAVFLYNQKNSIIFRDPISGTTISGEIWADAAGYLRLDGELSVYIQDLRWPSSDASEAGRVLASDASGNLYWTSADTGPTTAVPTTGNSHAHIIDLGTADAWYFSVPYTTSIAKITASLHGALTGGDETLSFKDHSGNSMGTIVLTQSGSAAGDTFSLTPLSNNALAEGENYRIETDGANGTATRVGVVVSFGAGTDNTGDAALDWEADTLDLDDFDDVGSPNPWADKIVPLNLTRYSTGSTNCTYRTNRINGYPHVYFGATYNLSSALKTEGNVAASDIYDTANGALTIVLLYYHATDIQDFYMYYHEDQSTPANRVVFWFDDSTDTFEFEALDSANAALTYSKPLGFEDNYHLWVLRRDGPNMSIRLDGDTVATRSDASGTPASWSDQIHLGINTGGSYAGPEMSYVRLMVYDNALSDTDVTTLESSISAKYNLGL